MTPCPYCGIDTTTYHEGEEACVRAADEAGYFALKRAHERLKMKVAQLRETIERLIAKSPSMQVGEPPH